MSDYPYYSEHEVVINDKYYFVTYNLTKDRMVVKSMELNEQGIVDPSEEPLIAEGFDDFCEDNGYLLTGSRFWSSEIDGYDESETKINMPQFIYDFDVRPAIIDFLTTIYKEQFT
jgi:hypothetical protein